LDLSLQSIAYISRCRNLLSTHVVFEYRSPTQGVLHVLPVCIRSDATGVFKRTPMHTRLPFEFMFQHELYHPHYNFHHCQLPKHLSVVDRILHQAQYPIGRSIGTFYQAAGGSVVLVSPSVPTLGYVLSDTELEHIENRSCSLLEVSPGCFPNTVVTTVIQAIANPDNRPSYILVPDREVPYWTEVFPMGPGIFILSFSDFSQTQLPDAIHVLVVDNAHQLAGDTLAYLQCRHILCLAPNVKDHLDHLIDLCGLQTHLPFPPLEPERDLCIFQELATATPPEILLLDPDPEVTRLHAGTTGSKPSSSTRFAHLLRVCAGGSVARMGSCVTVNGVVITDEVCSQTPFGSAADACMVCLAAVMVDPVVLPCRHVLCRHCLCEIAERSTTVPGCPCCRTLIEAPTTRLLSAADAGTDTRLQIWSKQVAVESHIQKALADDGCARVCLITAFESIARTYRTMLRTQGIRTCLYGFGEDGDGAEDGECPQVVVCSFGSFDRAVHRHCTSIVISDIGMNPHGLSSVLHCHNRPITVLLMRGCSDELLFRQWCSRPGSVL
jgi:hypothetical protein